MNKGAGSGLICACFFPPGENWREQKSEDDGGDQRKDEDKSAGIDLIQLVREACEDDCRNGNACRKCPRGRLWQRAGEEACAGGGFGGNQQQKTAVAQEHQQHLQRHGRPAVAQHQLHP